MCVARRVFDGDRADDDVVASCGSKLSEYVGGRVSDGDGAVDDVVALCGSKLLGLLGLFASTTVPLFDTLLLYGNGNGTDVASS